ncbi:hypothetical protein ACH5RR_015526 [Cinchona calisaya]|uniref:Uncharacterized protein n=1 Tax=Cinchona calisaya TaxID=153742 RepID=A0ABD2ZWZ9_9GENT
MNYHMTKQEHTLAELLKMLTLAQKETNGRGKETSLIPSTSKAKKFKPKKSNNKKRKVLDTKPSGSESKKDKKNRRATLDKENCFHYNKMKSEVEGSSKGRKFIELVIRKMLLL